MNKIQTPRPVLHVGFKGALAALAILAAVNVQASPVGTPQSTQTESNFDSTPLSGVNSATPLVMLTMSRDHQLHYKAYNDYTDLNGDGTIDTTYNGAVSYYGYFDPTKCYTYSTSNNYFVPAELATNGTDTGGIYTNSSVPYCNSGSTTNEWSGNFLNWLSMTRMDAVRKLLYGGYRQTDTATLTVLERDYLPTDAHAFAKYYGGNDIAKLTPFTVNTTASSSTSVAGTISSSAYNSFNISSISRSSSIATVTTSSAHGYIVGQSVYVSGTCNSAYNGIKTITAKTSTTFAYTVSGTPGNCTSAAGTSQLLLPITASSSAPVALGDQLKVQLDTSNYMYVVVTSLLDSSASSQTSITSGTAYVLMTAESTGTSPIISVTGSGTSTSLTVTDLSTTGISFCNLTLGSSSAPNLLSQTNTNPPLIRAVRGNFALWGANERYQCKWYSENSYLQGGFTAGLRSNGNRAVYSGIYANAENPQQSIHGLGTGSGTGEYYARVQVCKYSLEGSEKCISYPSTNSTYTAGVEKPAGLLQVYGEDGRINFGLLTTSYAKNISGGVVRKNTSTFANEVNVTTDGTFTGTAGIVTNINKLRIYGYNYTDGGYNNADNCTYQLVGLVLSGGSNTGGQSQNEGNCTSWGNPIGEAYMESVRYFAGLTPTSAFAYSGTTADSTLGLSQITTWTDPLTSSNYCASLNSVVFSASLASYDDDQAAGIFDDLTGAPSVATWTTSVGTYEGIAGGSWFIGNNGSTSNGLCNAKTISDLATANGICPEAPTLKGSYLIAGAAYYAHTNRIRSGTALSVPTTDTTSLKLDTYGIQLATNTPKIVIPVPSSTQTVTLLPVYRLDTSSNGSGPFGAGTIVDFKIVSQNLAAGTGSFYINWEDSAQGGDYDQDMWGILSYSISGSTITITTNSVAASTANGQGFGYIISGTTKDGPHFHSGIYAFDYTDATNVTVTQPPATTSVNGVTGSHINSSGGCTDCDVNDPATAVAYTLGTSSAGILQDPLYYAAKYGGFTDSNSNSRPDLQSEYDSHTYSSSGSSNVSDGIPDNYFLVSNPTGLESALQNVFNTILAKTSSGTAAAVVANDRQGEGTIYQALYENSRTDNATRKVSWIGTLQSLFVDSNGTLREDGNGDAALDESSTGYATDPAVVIYFDPSDSTTKFNEYTTGDPSTTSPTSTALALSNLRTIWNARNRLASLSSTPLSSIQANRTYTSSAANGRYIFTFRDHCLKGIPGGSGSCTSSYTSDVVDFISTKFGTGEYGMLNVASSTIAGNLVNYIRGDDTSTSGLRNRTIDYDNNGSTEVMRLGDIVDSSPTVVNKPAENFDLLYSDSTYTTFRNQYRERRSVVYVGANDGMLHAFNAGFYDPSTKSIKLQSSAATETQHPLGSELWAYVPFNLLPHLDWLTDPSYNHVWYVDGKPRVFDARIFTADTAHPNGWGTVLVVGLRFGGGSISLPVSGTCSTNAAFSAYCTGLGSGTSITTRSAYVLMDITNPEAAPTLIAELTDANLGFTTSYPTVASFETTGSTSTPASTSIGWYLFFGNGPDNSTTGLTYSTSSQTAKLYAYDLVNKAWVSGYSPYTLSSETNSFIGDPVSVDWELNFKANSLYFGTISTTVNTSTPAITAQSGKLYKLKFNDTSTGTPRDPTTWTAPVQLLNPADPVINTPSVTTDESGNHWVLGGTGRFLASVDKSSTQQGYLFGVIDTLDNSTPTTPSWANLCDVTSAKVKTDGTVSGVSSPSACNVTTENGLISAEITQGGWKLHLTDLGGTTTSNPAERSVAQTALLGDILFGVGFAPSNTLCSGQGSSELFGIYYKTGAAKSTPALFGTYTSSSNTYVSRSTYDALGTAYSGMGAAPGLYLNNGSADSELTLFMQTNTGEIVTKSSNIGNGARSGEIDWRELHQNISP